MTTRHFGKRYVVNHRRVAQLTERRTLDPGVEGLTPSASAILVLRRGATIARLALNQTVGSLNLPAAAIFFKGDAVSDYPADKTLPIVFVRECDLSEWPGHISHVLFIHGCNLNCPFCHAPDLVTKEKWFGLLSVDKIINGIDTGWIDSVVLTGGEPTLKAESLLSFCETLKARHSSIGIRLSTNGTNPETLTLLLDKKLIDSVALDVKHRLSPVGLADFTKTIGAEGVMADRARRIQDSVRDSVSIVTAKAPEFMLRTTVVNTATYTLHTVDDIENIAFDISCLAPMKRDSLDYVLQGFQPAPDGGCLNKELTKLSPTRQVVLMTMRDAAKKHLPKTRLSWEPLE